MNNKDPTQKVGFLVKKIFICDMLKRIPKSDISIRPFKAYKEWSFDSGSTEITLLEANISSSELSGLYPKNSIYGQLRAQFYNGNEDNPFLRFGEKTDIYDTAAATKERFLNGYAKVISIPQIYVGEGIKKGSFSLQNAATIYNDDSFGNLINSAGSKIYVSYVDINSSVFNFTDILDNSYSASIQGTANPFDISLEKLQLTYSAENYDLTILSIDIESGIMIVENIPFLQGAAASTKIGNVFYSQGLIILTRNAIDLLNSNWNLNYKSTKTIYEHEYLLIVEQDEFNVSTNPSAVVETGRITGSFTDGDGRVMKITEVTPVKYIRKKSILENGDVLDFRYTSSVSSSSHFAGFEHYFLSSSIDSTGSFLAPFITTIGLYDDNMDLVAVAKLPQPIKSEHDIPVNFIVRFDT